MSLKVQPTQETRSFGYTNVIYSTCRENWCHKNRTLSRAGRQVSQTRGSQNVLRQEGITWLLSWMFANELHCLLGRVHGCSRCFLVHCVLTGVVCGRRFRPSSVMCCTSWLTASVSLHASSRHRPASNSYSLPSRRSSRGRLAQHSHRCRGAFHERSSGSTRRKQLLFRLFRLINVGLDGLEEICPGHGGYKTEDPQLARHLLQYFRGDGGYVKLVEGSHHCGSRHPMAGLLQRNYVHGELPHPFLTDGPRTRVPPGETFQQLKPRVATTVLWQPCYATNA